MILATQFILNVDLGYWMIVLGIIACSMLLYGLSLEKTARLIARREP